MCKYITKNLVMQVFLKNIYCSVKICFRNGCQRLTILIICRKNSLSELQKKTGKLAGFTLMNVKYYSTEWN